MNVNRPAELTDLLAWLAVYAGDEEKMTMGCTRASQFAFAFEALKLFIASTNSENGKEKLRECERNLHVAYESYEHDDNMSGSHLVQDTMAMFQSARKYIDLSDE
jgi:hypothetical protein